LFDINIDRIRYDIGAVAHGVVRPPASTLSFLAVSYSGRRKKYFLNNGTKLAEDG